MEVVGDAPEQAERQLSLEPPATTIEEDVAAMSLEDATDCEQDDLVSCSSSVARLLRRFERDSILKVALLDPPTDRSVAASVVPEDVGAVDLRRRYATKVMALATATPETTTVLASPADCATVPEIEAIFSPHDQNFPEVEAVFQVAESPSEDCSDAKPLAKNDPPEVIKANSSDEGSRTLASGPNFEIEKPESEGDVYRPPSTVTKAASTPSPLNSRSPNSPGSLTLNHFGVGFNVDHFGYPISSDKFGGNIHPQYGHANFGRMHGTNSGVDVVFWGVQSVGQGLRIFWFVQG